MTDANITSVDVKEIKVDDETWISTCCHSEKKISKGFMKWIIQVLISLFVLAWSAIQISLTDENKEIYFSLISTIFGLYLPSPEFS